MSILNWLTGKKKREPSVTRIWLSKSAKYQAIAKEIRLALADELDFPTILVVAHFRDCFDELETLIATRKLENDRLHVTQAEDLPELTRRWNSNSGRTVFMVGEKHLLRSHDDVILDSARNLTGDSVVVFHVSLEDAVMRLFAGEWLMNTLRQLGMKEDEVIQHQIVSRQIDKAHRKIAERAYGDSRAKSAEEWLERNYPAH